MAAIMALETLKRACRVDLYTDSQYVRNGITQWIGGWKARGWRTAGNDPVKNADLWQRLDEARRRHEVNWHWVRGHDGNVGNERADKLTQRAIAEQLAAAKGGDFRLSQPAGRGCAYALRSASSPCTWASSGISTGTVTSLPCRTPRSAMRCPA